MVRLIANTLLCTLVLLCSSNSYSAQPEPAFVNEEPPIRIAAASSLQFVLNDIISAFVQEAGHTPPQVVYGSSGNLFRQIMQGAPFDLFLSADSSLIVKLEQANKVFGTGEQFGAGRLVLYANKAGDRNFSDGPAEDELTEFRLALERGSIGNDNKAFKISIANPRHAPYGRAAQQALESLGLWDLALPRLVYAEKVLQAAQYVVSGATELAIISRSLALSAALSNSGHYRLIPQQHHQPVEQVMIQIRQTRTGAALFEFTRDSISADNILRQYGLR